MGRSSTATASSRRLSRRSSAWSPQWVFGILSASLLASAILAPFAGRWADKFGAGRLMVPGSLAAAGALLFCALAPGRLGFAIGVLAMQLASCFVLYSTAFVAIVQLGDRNAQRSITHLTLDRRVCVDPILAPDHDAA